MVEGNKSKNSFHNLYSVILKTVISISILIFHSSLKVQAQETLSAAGGIAIGGGGSLSYTVGQVVYTTNTGLNGSGAQGVQQTYEISVIQGIEKSNFLKTAIINKSDSSSLQATIITDAKLINLKCIAYPNPTNDLLTLSFEYFDSMFVNLSYLLFDINGKLIESKNVKNINTNISMRNLVSATYFLNVLQGNTSIKIFKIIKN